MSEWLCSSGKLGCVLGEGQWCGESQLTNDVEIKGHADFWFCVHLALVNTSISLLGILYLQRPILRFLGMKHHESLIRCVRVNPSGEDVQVSFPDPGHLERSKEWVI